MPHLQRVSSVRAGSSAPVKVSAPAVVRAAAEQLWLFSDGAAVDLAALRREREMLSVAQRAKNTDRAYRSDWADFSAWCAAAGVVNLPATSDTLQLYMIDLARHGRAVSTITRRAAAIARRWMRMSTRSWMV
jgi:hypothetical protein